MQKFMKMRFFYIFFGLLSLILIFFAYYPVYQNFKQTPPDRYYFGANDYPLDMMGNLASAREGYLGRFMRFSKATTTVDTPPSLLKFEYILIGQTARLTHIDPLIIFYLTRILLTLLILFFIGVYLIPNLFESRGMRITASVLILFSTGILPAIPDDALRILLVMPSDIFVFQRLTITAHHYLLGILFSLVSLYFLGKTIDLKNIKSLMIASLFGFLSAWVYAPSIILIFLTFPVFWVFRIMRYSFLKHKKEHLKTGMILLIYIFITSLPILYLRYASRFFEFNTFVNTEKIAPYDITPVNYLMIVGLTYIISFFSLKKILRQGKALHYFFVSFLIMHPIAVFAFSNIFSLNKIRFFFTPYFIIFAILAAFGIEEIAGFIKKRFPGIPNALILVLLIFTVLYPSIHTYKMSYGLSSVCFCQKEFFDYGYPRKNVMEAVFWLRDHTFEDDRVLSGFYAGVLIPAFAGNKVYTSWWFRLMQLPNLEEVKRNLNLFYSQQLTSDAAYAFLQKEKIRYVYWGEEEQKDKIDKEMSSYPFLKIVKSYGNIKIYKAADEKI